MVTGRIRTCAPGSTSRSPRLFAMIQIIYRSCVVNISCVVLQELLVTGKSGTPQTLLLTTSRSSVMSRGHDPLAHCDQVINL